MILSVLIQFLPMIFLVGEMYLWVILSFASASVHVSHLFLLFPIIE